MDYIRITDIEESTNPIVFGVLQEIGQHTTSSGKEYVRFTLEDNAHLLECKAWDVKLEDFPVSKEMVGKLIKIKGNVQVWQGKKQLIVDKSEKGVFLARETNNRDGVSIDDFVKSSEMNPVDSFKDIKTLVGEFENKTLNILCNEVLDLYKEKLLFYPATQKSHHNYKGGLLEHMSNMIRIAEVMADIYQGVDRELLYSGIIFHDIGKLEAYISNDAGKISEFTAEGNLLGHIALGLKILNKISTEKNSALDFETVLLVEHMILSHQHDEERGSLKTPDFIEAEILHHLDFADSRISLIGQISEDLEEGEFSDTSYQLDRRRVYNHKK